MRERSYKADVDATVMIALALVGASWYMVLMPLVVPILVQCVRYAFHKWQGE